MEKIIIAHLSLQSNKIDEFLKLAEAMIKTSNEEPGCLTYKLLKEIDQENEFFFYERYKNEKAIEIHNSSNHFKSFVNSVMPFLSKEPTIEVF